jgi:hypothetical protein
VGFEQLFQLIFRYMLNQSDWMRSWVQLLPPGPLLSI